MALDPQAIPPAADDQDGYAKVPWHAYKIRLGDLMKILRGELNPTSGAKIPEQACVVGVSFGMHADSFEMRTFEYGPNFGDINLIFFHPEFPRVDRRKTEIPLTVLEFAQAERIAVDQADPPSRTINLTNKWGAVELHATDQAGAAWRGTQRIATTPLGVGDLAIPEGEAERFLPGFDRNTFGDAPPSAPEYISREVRESAHLIRGGLTAFDADPCATASLIVQPASV